MFCSTTDVYEMLKMDDTNHCTIVAWSVAFDADIHKSRKYLEYHGRPRKRGMNYKDLTKAIDNVKKYKVEKVNIDKPITLKKFCSEYKTGRYYALVSHHALAIIDGKVYDHSDRPLRRVRKAWKISNLEE